MKVNVAIDDIKQNYGAELLKCRGVEEINGITVDEFVNPTAADLQDWRDLDNIEDGLRLIDDLSGTSRVALVVDCDVDGYTSAAIIYNYLTKLYEGITIDYYIHSGKQHGLEDTWEDINEIDYDLIICPDSASNDAEYAKELEAQILVLDHHLTDVAAAPNMTVINNQLSPNYKNKYLSGAGVAYQFCRAMDSYFEKDWADDYVDLAALGICGDMMSGLEVENQYLWKKGFKRPINYFFRVLFDKQSFSMNGQMTPISVAFYIVPLINAMVRVGTIEEKTRMFEAFIDGHRLIPSGKRGAKGTLEEIAVESARECTNAKAHQKKFQETATEKIGQKIAKHGLLDNKLLFIRLDEDDNFPSELNGLVAMQLSQKYKRPTLVTRLNDEGYCRGSIRGLNNSGLGSLKDFLTYTGLFEYVQGHDNAAGCSILKDNLDRLHEIANEELKDIDFGEGCYTADFKRQALAHDLGDIIYDLDKYTHVWSQQNDTPLIYITDLHFTRDDWQCIGKNKDTFKLVKEGITYIKFFAKDMMKELEQYDEVKMEIVGKANVNEWNGTYTPQIQIENYEIKWDNPLDF